MPFTAKKPNAINTEDLKGLGKSVVDLAKYVDDEFAQVASALQSNDPFTVFYAAPTRPRVGMLVYADGTHWNPGAGEGFYEYTSGAVWVPLSATSIGGVLSNTFALDGTSGLQISGTTISIKQGSASQFGTVKVDGITITASGGVLSAVAETPSLSHITASLGADVALNNTANYFDGPSVAQGSTGVWFASGTVTLTDTGTAAVFDVKLWDGTTVVASCETGLPSTGTVRTVALSGFLSTPAGNLRISVKDKSATTGKILFNQSGNSHDSTITAIRIG